MKRIFTRLMLTVAMLLMCGAVMAQTGFKVYKANGEVETLEADFNNYLQIIDNWDWQSQDYLYYTEVWLTNGETLNCKELFLNISGFVLYNFVADEHFEIPISDVRKITFKRKQSDGIEGIVSENDFRRTGEGFTLCNLSPLSSVLVYDSNGRMVKTFSAGSEGRVEFSLKGLPAGVYAVKTSKSTYKILVK